MAKAKSTELPLTDAQLARFWSYVAKDSPNGCWLWTRGKTKAGYGMFHPSHGRNRYAHRLAWQLLVGPIPDDLECCHDCPGGDNPACCNPGHIYLATHKVNMRDAFAKGMVGSVRAKGEGHGMSKLTVEDIKAIRRDHAAGATMYSIAKQRNVHKNTIRCIVRRETWNHVPD